MFTCWHIGQCALVYTFVTHTRRAALYISQMYTHIHSDVTHVCYNRGINDFSRHITHTIIYNTRAHFTYCTFVNICRGCTRYAWPKGREANQLTQWICDRVKINLNSNIHTHKLRRRTKQQARTVCGRDKRKLTFYTKNNFHPFFTINYLRIFHVQFQFNNCLVDQEREPSIVAAAIRRGKVKMQCFAG